jgi:hypothetical protein
MRLRGETRLLVFCLVQSKFVLVLNSAAGDGVRKRKRKREYEVNEGK